MSGTQKVSGAWSSKLLCGDFNARSNCKIKFYWRPLSSYSYTNLEDCHCSGVLMNIQMTCLMKQLSL